MRFVLVALVLLAVRADAAPAVKSAKVPDVHANVTVPDNLADAADPMPQLYVTNDGDVPIEIQVFGGVPSTILEQSANGTFSHGDGAMCGNGFTAHRIEPHTHAFYALWSMISHGPGKSGTYRVVVPFVTVGPKPVAGEAASNSFELAYGDIAPADARDGKHPGAVVIAGAERQHNSPLVEPSPAALATKLLPEVRACVTAAQKKLPWLRGRFSLEVYQYGNPKPTLFVASSLLGDATVNACLGAIKVTDQIPTEYTLAYVVSPPTP